jgi:phosphatidylglycerophosphate synthase
MVRKIPSELENPIDNVLIDIGEYLSGYFRKLNLTANDITSISALTGIYSIYLFVNKKYILSAIFFFISHAFDCFDGFYARKYNMVSEFGDYYDHISDFAVDGIMLYLIARKYLKLQNNNLKKYIPVILIPLMGLLIMHFGCQEKYFKGDISKGGLLDYYKPICPIDANNKSGLEKFLKISRFFGSGTFRMYICILILLSGSIDTDIAAGR